MYVPYTITHSVQMQSSVSRKILSLEIDLSSLITMVTIVFSMLKITRGLKISFFEKLAPDVPDTCIYNKLLHLPSRILPKSVYDMMKLCILNGTFRTVLKRARHE